MTSYSTGLFANSPYLTYTPPLGNSAAHGWIEKPLVDAEPQYITSAPKASVSFDFYGDQFELSGSLTPALGGAPPCDYNVTINGQLQHVDSYYNPYDLPLGEYHVEVTFFCPQKGQQASFDGPAFVETQGSTFMEQTDPYLNKSQIHTFGPWQEEDVYQDYFAMTFPEYTSTTFGSTLTYSFKGVHTIIYGAVSPKGGNYIVTLDGVPQRLLTTYNPTEGDDVVIFYAQELNNDKTHTVTITNLGGELQIQAIQYTEFFPATDSK